MYLKKVKSKDITYLKLVETQWDKTNKKRVQVTLLNLGRLDTLMESGLPLLVKKLAETVNEQLSGLDAHTRKEHPLMVDIHSASETESVCYGHIIYRKLWDEYGFSTYLDKLKARSKIQFDLSEEVYLMTINQLLAPSSKYKLWQKAAYYLSLPVPEIQYLYRSLSHLSEHKQAVEHYIFEKNKTLFNQHIDLVFYDVTTFYFESQKADSLKDFGFDKDNKINNVHIVMGLLIDRVGKPIGYELFKGNTYEGHTLVKSIDKLRKRFKINTVVIVADKGLNSKMNLKEIRDAGYHYIVSGRLKNMPDSIKEKVFELSDYTRASPGSLSVSGNEKQTDVQFMYKTLDYQNLVKYKENPEDKNYKKISLPEKLICTYSSKRANKDQKDRERLLEKAQQIIDNNDKSKLENHRGHKKYVSKQHQDPEQADKYEVVLNQEKIEQDSKYDGFYVIQSSNEELSAKEVIENYHYLYKIEESFRLMKTTMQVRPINHWTPKRIEGHFVMSFIAFLLERELELRLIKNNKTNAPQQIKEAINSLQFTKITIDNQEFYIKSKPNELAAQILAVLKIKQPENVMSKQQMEDYMTQYFKT